MNFQRALRHLTTGDLAVRRAFPARAMQAIEAAISDTEAAHSGQIRFAVEAALDYAALRRDLGARERAIEVFSQLRVWDTERNNGVLIYLLLADRDVEIVADRGVDALVGAAAWEAICRDMETIFREGRFEEGVVSGIRAVGLHLAKHFPRRAGEINELPDRPVVL
ncbi:MAG: TPM domain-containing protein [Pseudomonadota bacterium]